MPKRNFGSSFLGGFSQTFNPTFQNVLDNLMQEERQRKIMDEQNRREAEEEKKRQQGRNAVMDLFRGGETTPTQNWFRDNIPFVNQDKSQFTPYTQEQQIEKIGQIFPEPSQYYNALKGILTPKPTKQSTVSAGGALYGYKLNPETNQLEIDLENPLVEAPKKILTTVEGYNARGEKEKLIKYTDGTEDRIGTGFYKATTPRGEITTKFDINLYRTALNNSESKYGKIKKQMQDYPELSGTINENMDVEEQTFYSTMLPSAREYVNQKYYDRIKKAGMHPEEEYTGRVEMGKGFTEQILEDYKDGTLNSGSFKIDYSDYPKPKNVDEDEWERRLEAETFKSILHWVKLKFDRL